MGGPPNKNTKVSPFMNAIIGGITGAMEITCTFPIEYTKTIMQLYPELNKKGAIKCVKDTVKEKGFFGMYRGYSALLLFSVPKMYFRFGAYAWIKSTLLIDNTRTNNFLSGLFAGAVESTIVVTPQETLKTKLIHDMLSEKPQYRNLFHGVYKIV